MTSFTNDTGTLMDIEKGADPTQKTGHLEVSQIGHDQSAQRLLIGTLACVKLSKSCFFL